jgi:hypothetical protein
VGASCFVYEEELFLDAVRHVSAGIARGIRYTYVSERKRKTMLIDISKRHSNP